ncbi:nucleotidyl transferase [Mycobacterium phage Reindeer]|uniref:Nucleotidyl transferase n=1 Tax=Mycobacterium phage Reindeer TaxID=2762283 RepID=A0A7G8LHY7_9CAUD|nr:tRNA nucleotidyltransferase [Mycobacterium phage Reindeer]QNJ56859.1 nucleotidyl transferase [Mycobacterium phage Reindeer]
MSHNSPWHRKIAQENLIYKTEVGSRLHGVTVGADDNDEMGMCIAPPECVIGTRQFEQYQDRWHADGTRIPEGVRSGPGDTDQVIYSLQKWARLAAQGNPTVLIPLFAPRHHIYFMNDSGAELVGNRDLFLSKQAGGRFIGYLVAQRERAQGLRGRKHTNRPELVEKCGYDTKMMYHATRLAIQGEQLMTEGEIHLPMLDYHRDYLLAVRDGQYNLQEALSVLEWRTDLLRKSMEASCLPDHPDYEQLDNWLIGMHYNHWKTKGML